MRAALVRESLAEAEPCVRRELLRAVAKLESLGARVDELSLPFLKDMLPAYHILGSAEASSNLARFDGVRYGFRASGVSDWRQLIRESRSRGFGLEVKRRILLGTFVLTKEQRDAYEKARRLRRKKGEEKWKDAEERKSLYRAWRKRFYHTRSSRRWRCRRRRRGLTGNHSPTAMQLVMTPLPSERGRARMRKGQLRLVGMPWPRQMGSMRLQ